MTHTVIRTSSEAMPEPDPIFRGTRGECISFVKAQNDLWDDGPVTKMDPNARRALEEGWDLDIMDDATGRLVSYVL